MTIDHVIPNSPKSPRSRSTGVAPGQKFKFTKSSISEKELPAPETGRYYVYDSLTRGLCISVMASGIRTYYVYRRNQGRPVRYRLGLCEELTIDEARTKADEYNVRIAHGENPQLDKQRIRQEDQLSDLWKKFITDYADLHLRPKTCTSYRSMWNRHLAHSPLALRKLSEIKRADLERLHQRIGSKHRHAANRCLELLGSMFSRARKDWSWEGLNPAEKIEPFTEESRKRYLDPQELHFFFKALAAEENTGVRDAFLLLLLTGARRGNVTGMKWEQINWQLAEWRIPSESSKSGKSYTVALGPEALAVLQSRLKTGKGDYVFPGTGKSKHLLELKSAWTRVIERAKALELAEWKKENPRRSADAFRRERPGSFADVRIHDLRRSYGVAMASSGHPC